VNLNIANEPWLDFAKIASSIRNIKDRTSDYKYKALRRLIRQVYRLRDETFKYLTAVLTFYEVVKISAIDL